MSRDSYGRICRAGSLAVSPPDELDGPEIFESDVDAVVDSGEFCDRSEIDGENFALSGSDVFFDALNGLPETPGLAAALWRAMRGMTPRPGDLPAMYAASQQMRERMLEGCRKTLYAEACREYA